MKPLFTLFILLITSCAFAQRQNVYFLKNDGKYVDSQDSADYIRIVREPDSASVLYNVLEFYKSGKRKLIGKSSTIDPPRFEGQCVGYFGNGKRKSSTFYKDGVETGTAFEFYPNGRTYQITMYPDDTDENNRYDVFKDNYLITANYDSLGNVQVENGNGYYKAYDIEFKYIYEEGAIKNGKKDGVWTGKLKSRGLTFNERYENGTLISGIGTFDDGSVINYTKSRGIAPQFKGGINAFYAYLSKYINYPDFERANNIQGKVIVCFVVEKDGKISEAKVTQSVSERIDAEALRVVKKTPPWIPGTSFGKPVRVKYNVPVSFSLSD